MTGDDLARAAISTALLTGVLGLVGLIVAYGQRSDPEPTAAVALLAATTVIAAVSAACGVGSARRPAGLRWPDGVSGSWPMWPWWWVIGVAGSANVLTGPLVNGWLGVVGVLLIGAACLGLGRDLLGSASVVDRAVVCAARRLRAAVAENSDAAVAAVAPVGALGARVVVFTPAGRLADVVMRDVDHAELAARVAGLDTVASTELHPPLRTG